MSKLRLTKEQKKIRKELIKYHDSLPANKKKRKDEHKAFLYSLASLLLIFELVKGED